MTSLDLLKEAEKAFHEMDWQKVVDINSEIIAKKPGKKIKNLSNGFYYYALAKLEKDHKRMIMDLEKAGAYFKTVDSYLTSLADIEKLILLSEFDKENRDKNLLDLAELSQDLFIKTDNVDYLLLAIDAFKGAKLYFKGKKLEQILLGLQFCYGNYAPTSENPEKYYRKIIEFSTEIKIKDSPPLARSKMNAAAAHHNLAFVSDYPLESIKTAIKLNREAIKIFKKIGSHPETVKALQCLANELRDASGIDNSNAKKYLEKTILIKREIVEMLLKEGFSVDSGYECLDIGTICIELAICDKTSSEGHFKNAITHFNSSTEIFSKEACEEGLGHAKAGVAAVYKNQGKLKEAAEMFDAAIAIFKGKDPVLLGYTKQNLAATYRDLSKATGQKELITSAEKLEKEATKLLKTAA